MIPGAEVLEGEVLEAEVLESTTFIMIGMTVVFGLLYGVLVWFIGRGSNWARWALLAFVVGSTLIAASDVPRSLSETPVAVVVDVFITLAEVWAFRLLFFGPAREWFRPTYALTGAAEAPKVPESG